MSNVIYFDTGIKPKASQEMLYIILLQMNMISDYHKDEFTEEEWKILSSAYTELAKLYNERISKC